MESGGNIVTSIGNANVIGTCDSYDFILQAQGKRSLFITTGGFIGVGENNTTPLAALDVSDPTSSNLEHLKIYGDNDGSIEATGDMNLFFNNSFVINRGSKGSSSNILEIDPSERFGIGITPVSGNKLTIQAGSINGIQSRTSSNSTKALSIYNTTSSQEKFIIYGDGKTNIGYQTSQLNAAMLNLNVQGASGAPVNAFDIFDQYTGKVNFRVKSNGYMWCRELTVEYASATFPDFVFEPTYQLQTLQDRECYIIANKKLPYMISAKEVEANGAPLGELIKGVLQNTEELTLYLIELNKKVEVLKMENEELKKQLLKNFRKD